MSPVTRQGGFVAIVLMSAFASGERISPSAVIGSDISTHDMQASMEGPLSLERLKTFEEDMKANTNLQKQLESILADPALRAEAKAVQEKLASQLDVLEEQLKANPSLEKQLEEMMADPHLQSLEKQLDKMMADPHLQHQAELVHKMLGDDLSQEQNALHLDAGVDGASLAEASSVATLQDKEKDPIRLFGQDTSLGSRSFDIGEEVSFYTKGADGLRVWIEGVIVQEDDNGETAVGPREKTYSVGYKDEESGKLRKRNKVKARNIRHRSDDVDDAIIDGQGGWKQWPVVRVPVEAAKWAKQHPGQTLIYALMLSQNPLFKSIFGDPAQAMQHTGPSHVL